MLSFPAEAILLVVPLFTRISQEAALSHETRARLHDHLRRHPAASRRDLCGALGVHPMTLLHHLEVLVSLGLVTSRREGREVLYWLGVAPPRAPLTLRVPPRRDIARALIERPQTQAELSARTGLSQRLVAYHLARMGPLLETDRARPRRYQLRDRALVAASLDAEAPAPAPA